MTPTSPRASPALWRDGEPPPPALAGAVVAIGNFDGVHRGHQALLATARRIADAHGLPAGAFTFEPHPRAYFGRDDGLFRLSPPAVKIACLDRLGGVDGVFVKTFDAALAATWAADFIERLLRGELRIGGLVVGEDFHFGRGREGDARTLGAICARAGLHAAVVPPVTDTDGTPISSSAIREALAVGDVDTAARRLGYHWFVRAPVVHGAKRGRDLGYPTANMRLDPGCRLRHGIYAVRMAIAGAVREGVASFGRRPTFDDGAPLLETFLFDFRGDLYGQEGEVEFVAFLRPELRFEGIDALIAQMDRDAAEARAALARPSAAASLVRPS